MTEGCDYSSGRLDPREPAPGAVRGGDAAVDPG